jgi:hypothetical protein
MSVVENAKELLLSSGSWTVLGLMLFLWARAALYERMRMAFGR